MASIEINGLMVTDRAMEYLIERLFWKRSENLTVKGQTDEHARMVTNFLLDLGRDDYIPELKGVEISQRGQRGQR
jgi:hypothetical protein